MKTVTKIIFDYCPPHTKEDYPEEYQVREVGVKGVVKIEEHEPANGLERHYFDISMEDGSSERTFNPNRAFYANKP